MSYLWALAWRSLASSASWEWLGQFPLVSGGSPSDTGYLHWSGTSKSDATQTVLGHIPGTLETVKIEKQHVTQSTGILALILQTVSNSCLAVEGSQTSFENCSFISVCDIKFNFLTHYSEQAKMDFVLYNQQKLRKFTNRGHRTSAQTSQTVILDIQ